MQLGIDYHPTWGCYDAPVIDYPSPERLVALHRPHVRISRPLKEATYKEIVSLIDPLFLQQAVRASELRGVRLAQANPDWAGGRQTPFDPEDTMNFYVDSSEHSDNGVSYLNSVKFDDWEEVGSDPDYKSSREKALMLLWQGDIRLHCTCPSFLFWGYQYLLTVIDASIYQELRRPVIRNAGTTKYGPPADRGIVCKHMNRVLKALPFYNADIGKEIQAQFGANP